MILRLPNGKKKTFSKVRYSQPKPQIKLQGSRAHNQITKHTEKRGAVGKSQCNDHPQNCQTAPPDGKTVGLLNQEYQVSKLKSFKEIKGNEKLPFYEK